MPNKMLFTNNAATTLASSINNIVTSLTVATGGGALFPSLSAGQYFYCTLSNTSGTVEIVKVTARSTDTFTIVRAQDNTSATSWNSGDKVELRLVNADLINFPQLDSDNTFAGTNTFSTTITGSISGNAGTATTAADLSATLAVNKGGTGQTSYTNGQLLIGNTTGNTLTKATLTAGTGISVTNSTGSITIANTLSGGFSNMQVFASPGTFTTPSTTTQIKVTVVGGGGGGATQGFPALAGGGGAGGGGAIYVGPVTVSTPYTVTVGSGGAGGTAPSPTGGTGGTSSFGPLASATGGAGGIASLASALGGLGSAGTLQFAGGAGEARASFVTPGTPAPTIASRSGFGGSSYLGGGGNSVTGANAGVAGRAYGGGGSGASGPGGPGNGGAGAAGVVIVEY